jgi:hypothetical protein
MKKLVVLMVAFLCVAAGCDNAGKNTVIPIMGSSGGSSSGSSSWYTMLGSTMSEIAQSARQTADGGYIIAGFAGGDIPSLQGKTPLNAYTSGNDILVVKLNSSGNVSWYTFFGGAGWDKAYSVQQTADEGFIIAGYADSNIASLQGKTPRNPYSGSSDMLVMKLNSSGKVSWYTFLSGSGVDAHANSVQQTADGGCIVAGFASASIASLQGTTPLNAYKGGNDMLVVKLNSSGNVTWHTFLGSTSGSDTANSIQQTADGGYFVAGVADIGISPLDGVTLPRNVHTGNGSNDMMAVKLTSSGHVSWYTYLGGTGIDWANSAQQTADGGYIIAGLATADIASLPKLIGTASPNNDYAGGSSDMLVVKLNTNGYVTWHTFLGSTAGDSSYSIQQTTDGGYIVAGYATGAITDLNYADPLMGFNGGQDCLVVKLDESGDVSGYTFLGGSGTGNEVANSIQQTADGGYIVAGFSAGYVSELGGMWPLNPFAGANDLFIVKLNPGGGL